MIVNHEWLEEDAVFFIDLPESIQQADKAVISLALCGEYLLQQGELALLDSREDILDSLKVNIESGTVDSGALYDLLYGNAPEFFSRYRSQNARSIFALVRFRAAVYSDIRSLPGVFSYYYSPVSLLRNVTCTYPSRREYGNSIAENPTL